MTLIGIAGMTTSYHYVIPAGTNGAGSNVGVPTAGISFNTGISFRITTGMADNDANAASANDIVVNLDYK